MTCGVRRVACGVQLAAFNALPVPLRLDARPRLLQASNVKNIVKEAAVIKTRNEENGDPMKGDKFDTDELANRRMAMIETREFGHVAARMLGSPARRRRR